MEKNIHLGFLELPEHAWALHRNFFPSKVGGKPAWLNPTALPQPESMICPVCKDPMAFLLQVYAPESGLSNSFHRTIFVFCCKSGSCYTNEKNVPVKVLRCNLSRRNDFYSYDPPNYNEPTAALSSTSIHCLCIVCGCVGKKFCSRCKTVTYCGKKHQTIHWKQHKSHCSNSSKGRNDKDEINNFIFPEFELVIEPEDEETSESSCSEEIDSLPSKSVQCDKFSEEELNRICANQREDEVFSNFKETLSREPEQVIRHKRGGSPLWCSEQNQPTVEDIPLCQCGSKRSFEFQIMPHLLSHLDVDTTIEGPTIDWGTIAVYTCDSDCSPKSDETTSSYVKEFAWKQVYSEENRES